MLSAPAPGDRRDAGFTLVELLITIVILGIITVPLSGVLIGFFRNADATSDRMALSHDAQISAAGKGESEPIALTRAAHFSRNGAGTEPIFRPSKSLISEEKMMTAIPLVNPVTTG